MCLIDVFIQPTRSELFDINLDGLMLARKTITRLLHQITIRQIFQQRFEQRRLNHVERGLVVVRLDDGATDLSHAKRSPGAFLIFEQTHGRISQDSSHFSSLFSAERIVRHFTGAGSQARHRRICQNKGKFRPSLYIGGDRSFFAQRARCTLHPRLCGEHFP